MTSQTDDQGDELGKPATGTAGRVAIVVGILLVAVTIVWWLWPDHGRGEREQAHRVLVVGGTPTDLIEPIAEAGFEAVQWTWADADVEVTSLEGRFDLDALLGYADEHGYGFVAIVFGDDYPWTRTILGAEAPAAAEVAVVAIGELAPEGPEVRFGGPPPELDYAPGVRRSEALRLALYDHPDLLRLWADPTPEQMQQQVHLGKLDEARILLERASQTYAKALTDWPSLPPGALMRPWTEVRGVPLAGGILVETRAQKLVVNERRQIEGEWLASEAAFVPDAALATNDPLAGAVEAAPKRLPEAFARSADHRWLFGRNLETGEFHRYEIADGGLVDRGSVDVYGEPVAISNQGQPAWTNSLGVATSLGVLEFFRVRIDRFDWYGNDRVALALTDFGVVGFDEVLSLVVFARPDGDTTRPPALLTISTAELLGEEPRVDMPVNLLRSTSAGLFLLIEHRSSSGGIVDTLVRLTIPEGVERRVPPTIVPPGPNGEPPPIEPHMLTTEVLRAAQRPAAEFEVTAIGIVPPHVEFDVAPDGRHVAWRSEGNKQTVRVAAILADGLGPAIELDDAPDALLPDEPGPWFRADGGSLVFADALAITDLGVRTRGGADVLVYLRVMPVPVAAP